MSSKGALEPLGGRGGAMGVLRGLALWDPLGVDPDAGRPRLGGLVGGWARLTKSSPDESDSLSDSGIWQSLNGTGTDCQFQFFHRELSFFEFHITGYFEALVGSIPELVSFGSRFIANEDHSSTLWL